MLRSTKQSAPVLYSFPELKNQDVLECLGDLGIPLSEPELVRPTVLTVQRVYEMFVEMFMGSGNNNASSVLEMLEYPELHSESVSLIGLYRSVYILITKL